MPYKLKARFLQTTFKNCKPQGAVVTKNRAMETKKPTAFRQSA